MHTLKDATATYGSIPLSNPKWEEFASKVAMGVGIRAAHAQAGYKDRAPNASRMAHVPEIAARIAYLKVTYGAIGNVDQAWVRKRLAEHAMHLTEVVFTREGKKPGPLFNAPAGTRALELLGKDLGMFSDKLELGGQVQVDNSELYRKMTAEERAEMRAILVAAMARDQATNDNSRPIQSIDYQGKAGVA